MEFVASRSRMCLLPIQEQCYDKLYIIIFAAKSARETPSMDLGLQRHCKDISCGIHGLCRSSAEA